MVEFNIPDSAFDLTTITEAAKRNGVIIIPNNHSNEVIEYLQEQINELGYTHSDGSAIPVVNWNDFLNDKEEYDEYCPIFFLYKDIFAEMLGYTWADDIVLMGTNDI